MTSISAENSAFILANLAFVQTSLHDSSALTLYRSIISIEVVDSLYRLTSTSILLLSFLRLKNLINDIINDGMKKAITCVIGFFCFLCWLTRRSRQAAAWLVSQVAVSAHCRYHLLDAFHRERRIAKRLHRNAHQLHRVVIRRNAIRG